MPNKRKVEIIKAMKEQNKLNPIIEKEIRGCYDKFKLEDFYQ